MNRIKAQTLVTLFLFFILCAGYTTHAFSQEEGIIETLKFKDADIRVVLQAITQKATKGGEKINILVAPEIKGLVTVDLTNVGWQTALEAVLKTYDYDFEWIGTNIILVDTLESLAEKRQKALEAKAAEPLETVTYRLRYLDAHDIQRLVAGQLTSRGRISVLEVEPQRGWRARGGYAVGGASDSGSFDRAQREAGARPRSKTLIITDTKSNLRNVMEAIEKIDLMPSQVLIEARIMEVNRDKLKDIGLDFSTGQAVLSSSDTTPGASYGLEDVNTNNTRQSGGWITGGRIDPSIFSPRSSDIDGSLTSAGGIEAGLEFIFRKLSGTEYEVILHALEEDVESNTLSAPRVLTLDGQEAYIMVGERRPIIQSSISSSENSVGISKSLDYYQNLGIELNVVPQICGDNYVNMVIYPSVTSSSTSVSATSQIGESETTDTYPIILVRETQTQILIKDGETIAIGGLLKDVKSEGIIKTPILGDIPLFGLLFQRRTSDLEKIDLIVFITVKILRPVDEMAQASLTKGSSASAPAKQTK